MSMFGIEEVIRPLTANQIVAEKEAFFGASGYKVDKVGNSCKPESEQMTLAEVIKVIKHIYAGNSDYSYIEFFTDKTGKVTGVSHMNVCHMKRTK